MIWGRSRKKIKSLRNKREVSAGYPEGMTNEIFARLLKAMISGAKMGF